MNLDDDEGLGRGFEVGSQRVQVGTGRGLDQNQDVGPGDGRRHLLVDVARDDPIPDERIVGEHAGDGHGDRRPVHGVEGDLGSDRPSACGRFGFRHRESVAVQVCSALDHRQLEQSLGRAVDGGAVLLLTGDGDEHRVQHRCAVHAGHLLCSRRGSGRDADRLRTGEDVVGLDTGVDE